MYRGSLGSFSLSREKVKIGTSGGKRGTGGGRDGEEEKRVTAPAGLGAACRRCSEGAAQAGGPARVAWACRWGGALRLPASHARAHPPVVVEPLRRADPDRARLRYRLGDQPA